MATRLKDGQKPFIAGDGIQIDENNVISVLLREANNLIHVNENGELYTDLQLPAGIQPTDDFPVGVTTGKILAEDGWISNGLIINWKTTSGDYARLILASNHKLYIDKGDGIWEEVGGGGGGGSSYFAGHGIDINASNVISNLLGFEPGNQGTEGQVLKKTNNGYEWSNESSGESYTAGDGINIDGNNEISNTAPFSPTNQGASGQVLKTDGNGNIYWGNESGGGGSTYTAGDGIDITNDVITNTMYPTNQGTSGQVLKNDGNGNTYWANESGGGGGNNIAAGENISIEKNKVILDNQGPCPEGFHIPTNAEWQAVNNIVTQTFGLTDYGFYLKMPLAGYLQSRPDNPRDVGTYGQYRACDQFDDNYAQEVHLESAGMFFYMIAKSRANSIRPFKDTALVPDSSWTVLYDGSATASGAGIFYTDGYISMSADGSNWITIADRNLGATEAYTAGGQVTVQNRGNYYQWGNNYGFNGSNGTIVTGQVDTTGYGPGNYYNSNGDYYGDAASQGVNWSMPNNANLWGGVSQSTGTYDVINATIPEATADSKGAIKLGSDDVQYEPASTPTQASGRTFPVQVDQSGRAVVNVPDSGGGGSAEVYRIETYTSGGTAAKTATLSGYTPQAGDLILTYFANGNSADNITLSINSGTAYPIQVGGNPANSKNFELTAGAYALLVFTGSGYAGYVTQNQKLSAGTNITINANGVISATDTTYSAGSNIHINGNNVISAENTEYTAGTGINITSGDVIENTAPFNPASAGTTGQILMKTANSFDWITVDGIYSNVRAFLLTGTPADSDRATKLSPILDWISKGASYGAIVKWGQNVFVYGWSTTAGQTTTYYFPSLLNTTDSASQPSTGYTTLYNDVFKLVTVAGNIDGASSVFDHWNNIANFIEPTGTTYTGTFTPTVGYHPATKQYVDAAVSQATGGGIICDPSSPVQINNIWAGTEAQFLALATRSTSTAYLTSP